MQLQQFTITQRCKNDLAKKYVTNVMSRMITVLKNKEFRKHFKYHWNTDYLNRLQNNGCIKAKEWYKNPGPKREYNPISEYRPAEGSYEDIYKVLETTKKSFCGGDCC
jgi:hypothetical protein